MGKRTDKIGSIEEFKAPWETESGEDAEIDKPKLRRLLFNARLSEAKALDQVDEVNETVAAVEKERDEAKEELAKANGDEAQKTIDRLTAENTKLKGEKKAREEADALETLRKDVLGDFAEKHPKAAKYVVGTTEEELEKSLEAVKADFGISDDDNEDEEVEEEETVTGRTRPISRLKTGLDSQSGKPGEAEIDFDKVADDIIGAGRVFG